ncbi:MAG: ATPase [Pseudomonadota bacterium]
MSQNNQSIRAVEGETSKATTEGNEDFADYVVIEESAEEPYFEDVIEFDEDVAPPSRWPGRIITGLALVTALGWTGLYTWAMQDQLLSASTAAPTQWVRWIIDWSVPVLLVCMVWMLAMRSSTHQANRFAATAAKLSAESAELENRLTVVNRELSLAREFLASQSRDLETLGRVAAERLSTNAAELQELVTTNGKQVEAIGTASDTALANMTRLRDDLPVIANSARDVNNHVGTTGRTAREQLDKLIAGFERLNTFGAASEKQVGAYGQQVGETMERFEAQLGRIEQTLATRFAALQSQADDYRGSISETETEALEAMNQRITLLQSEMRAVSVRMRDAEAEALTHMRQSKEAWEQEVGEMVQRLERLDQDAMAASQSRIKELHDEAGRFDDHLQQRDARFMEELAKRQSEFEHREAQAAQNLSKSLTAFDNLLSEKREAHLAENEKIVAQSEDMAAQLDKLTAMIDRVEEVGASARMALTEGLDALGENLQSQRAGLTQTQEGLEALTDASVRLLEIIQSGAKHSREDLPAAIKTASDELTHLEDRSTALSDAMLSMGQKGEDLSSYLIKTQSDISETDTSIEALQAKVIESSEEALSKLNGLRGGLERLTLDSEAFAGETQDALIGAISKLEEATKATTATLEESARAKVTGLAEELSKDAVSALERALRSDSAETIGKLEQAAAHASGVGREATVQLRDQLARVHELTGNLEQRISRANELAEEKLDNDFARRMALITDSLNSAAIDISGSLSTEVSDSAWDSYLKGDRGIFTRRAVRLLDGGEAKAISGLYQEDETFKANVNRYIHDFEAMLRSMLSTRDGNALSVTILGSDMGKLYVALAQSIERLRK